ncbi:PLDc N-terminal domain-containing protein [Autumnicola edwardsiae]|uniref:PLDc N-terminal domain-containing protein n=1 Tax=Autumnicola edwardsiae TaxID=3075594 RepID=UPI003D782752
MFFTLIGLTAILWIWAAVDIFRARFKNPVSRFLWLVVIVFFPIIGSLIYFQFGRRRTRGRKIFNPDFRRSH